MALKAFISYSTTDKIIAGKVKAILDDYRIPAFLAHEDINVSQDWKIRIVEEITQANVFIPLLSKAFKLSDWASQEIGLVYFRRDDVCFIPLSIDGTIPFGFISHVQGKPIPATGISTKLIVDPLIARFPNEMIPLLLQQLSEATSYRGAEGLMLPLVPLFDKFDDAAIESFVTTAIDNGQIWSANLCANEYIPAFIKMHRERIPADKLKALEYQITSGHWYKPEAT